MTNGADGSSAPHSISPKTASTPPISVASTPSRHRRWPITVASGRRQLPFVWSPWWWVLTSVRIGWDDTAAIASSSPRVLRSVEQVSTATTPLDPTRKPVLLTHQLPSGCT